MSFGSNLKKIRSSKNMNKRELSKNANISDAYLHRIEKNDYIPMPEKFVLLLGALLVNLDELETLIEEYYKINPGVRIREK